MKNKDKKDINGTLLEIIFCIIIFNNSSQEISLFSLYKTNHFVLNDL